jgi:hypothetical protein
MLGLEAGAVGLVAGVLGAALGVGGGVVLVPGFVLLLGLTPHAAIGTSLVCVVATAAAATAAHLRLGTVRLGDALDLPLFGALGAFLAALAAAGIPPRTLMAAFAALLGVTAVLIWPRHRPAPPAATRPALIRAGVLGGGAMAGLFGVGGGIVFVPLLHLWGGRTFRESSAQSLLIIVVTAASGLIGYALRGDVSLTVALPAALGALLGGTLGVSLAARLRQQALKGAFAILLVYVAIRMLHAA